MGESKSTIYVVETLAQADELLDRRSRNALNRAIVLEKEAAAVKDVHVVAAEILAPVDKDDAAIDEALATYLLRRRKSLLARFGKTIRLPHGVVTWMVKARSVDSDRDVTDAIRFLENHPDGEQYLTRTTTLNRDALATCDDANLLRALRRRRVRVSKHELLNVKPEGFAKPVLLSRRLYPRRR